jgi:DNA-binding response OmpR family regulator
VGADRRRTILVVEDDPELRDMLQDTLVPAGFEVLSAKNGIEGIRLFRSHRIDLAIVDIFMPEKDGFETLMEMRRHAAEAKVIVISGGGGLKMAQVLIWADKLGAAETLAKPFSPKEIIEAVNRLLAIAPTAKL